MADESIELTPTTISRIPAQVNLPHLYEPTVLSIGPYSANSRSAFDEEKRKSVESLSCLELCKEAVRHVEPKARRCYEDAVEYEERMGFRVRIVESKARMDAEKYEELIELLVRDGYFIIELFYSFFSRDSDLKLLGPQNQLMVWTDLLKLPNQIPFLVLEVLFETLLSQSIEKKEWLQRLSQKGSKDALKNLAVRYLADTGPKFQIPMSWYPPSDSEVHHLLHLYYLCLTPHPQQEEKSNLILRYTLALADSLFLFADIVMTMIFSPHRLLRCIFMKASAFLSRRPQFLPLLQASISIPCATQLQEDGVKFVKKRKCNSLCDVTFSRRRAIMRIPQLSIHGGNVSITLFANLMQYEQLRCKDQKKDGRLAKSEYQKKYMISYVFLMDCLVRSERDAAALRKSEIIVSDQDDKEVAEFFSEIYNICDVSVADFWYADLSNEVKKYREFKLLRWRAYFPQLKRHPWALISCLSALILFCLAIVQTFFTTYPYYHPRSK